MKKLNYALSAAFLLIAAMTFGQVSHPGNDATAPLGSFLGWDHARDLELKTNDDTHLLMRQNGFSLINGFNIDRSGFIGISQDPSFFTISEPYSLLHLNGDNSLGSPQTGGYRDWMRFGIVSTHNQDLMFMGQMDRGESDQTSATIAWADNTGGTVGPDNLRFIFVSGDGTSPSGSSSTYGLETMRISPVGNVGIGDFSSIGLNEQPSFRLDVDGNARFRQIAQGPGNVLITGKQEGIAGDYSLRYLSFSGNQNEYLAGDGTWQTLNNNNCEWNINGNDISMGYAGACQTGNVGIGNLAQGDSRLYIEEEVTTNFENVRTLDVRTVSSAGQSSDIGINSEIINEQYGFGTAVRGFARGGKSATGGDFSAAHNYLSSTSSVGVVGSAENINTDNANHPVIGVYGIAESNVPNSRAFGVYGEGIASVITV